MLCLQLEYVWAENPSFAGDKDPFSSTWHTIYLFAWWIKIRITPGGEGFVSRGEEVAKVHYK